MAIYHLNLTTGSKGGGKSAGAKSDYITREGKYELGKEELLTQIHGNLPSFAENDPSHFWKSADKYEAENGRLYIQIEFALPRELNEQQQIELAKKFTDTICNTDTYNLPYTLAIHKGEYDHKGKKSKSDPTPHCHLIISERGIDNIDRTAELFFKRANTKNPANGGAKKIREIKSKEWLKDTRELWANLANQSLEKAGFEERIDHRTLLEQGITDRKPKSKIYWNANQNLDKEIEQEELKKLSAEELSLIEEITKIDNEIAELNEVETIINSHISEIVEIGKNTPNTKNMDKQIIEKLQKNFTNEYEKKGKEGIEELHKLYLAELAKRAKRAKAEEDRKAEEEAKRKAELEAKAKAEVEAKRQAEEELLETKFISFTQEYKEIQGKELSEISKTTLRKSFAQEYEKGGEKAVDEYISSYLTSLKNRKEKAEYEKQKAEFIESKLIDFAKKFEEIAQKKLVKELLIEPLGTEYEKGGEKAVDDYISNYLTDFENNKKKAEEEAKKRAEAEAKAKAQEEARAKQLAEQEAKRQAEEEKERKADEEAKAKEKKLAKAIADVENTIEQIKEEEKNKKELFNKLPKLSTNHSIFISNEREQNIDNIKLYEKEISELEQKLNNIKFYNLFSSHEDLNLNTRIGWTSETHKYITWKKIWENRLEDYNNKLIEASNIENNIKKSEKKIKSLKEQLSTYAENLRILKRKLRSANFENAEQQEQWEQSTLEFLKIDSRNNSQVIKAQEQLDYYATHQAELENKKFEAEKLVNPFAKIQGITLNEAKELKQLSERLFNAIKSEVFRQKTGSQTFQEENTRQFAEGTVRNAYFIGGGGKNGVNVAKRAVENEIRETPEKVRQLVLSLKKERVLTR